LVEPHGDRKLAAILSADVAGYSRLMADDETGTIRRLSDYREAVDLLVRQHRGRVVDAPGDNILAEFPTALDAVRAALEIQAVLRARNMQLPVARRMEFRIGVHMGDVAVDGERIYGDGVNIAARLERLADAGGVCISATVHEQVRNKLEVGFADLGDQTVKNIPDQVHVYRVQPKGEPAPPPPVAEAGRRSRTRTALVAAAVVLALLAAGLVATWPAPLGWVLDLAGVTSTPAEPTLPDKPSVVVLPFDNLSGDANDPFADGITEELTADLSGNPNLFVISRNSAYSYKGQPVRVEQVGRELGVRYVVEGSVRRAGDQVRITAQLIDASSGVHLWSEQYDRALEDIFAVQSEISEAILAGVGVEVRDAELARIRRRPTDDLSAYEAYTRGFSLFVGYRRQDLPEARRMLERAIALDPDYAEAYALLASTYTAEYALGWTSDRGNLDRSRELLERSVEIDRHNVGAHIGLAAVAIVSGLPQDAMAHARKAMGMAPNFAAPHAFLAVALASDGQPLAALQSMRTANRLDPRMAEGTVNGSIRAAMLLRTGRTDEALELFEQSRAANPDLLLPRIHLAYHRAEAGRLDEARVLVEELLRIDPQLTVQKAAELASRWDTVSREERVAQGEALREVGLP
jgi:TolB-like protein/class 3 adenylate cyclase